jgi:hypothetical protein
MDIACITFTFKPIWGHPLITGFVAGQSTVVDSKQPDSWQPALHNLLELLRDFLILVGPLFPRK